jgi:ATP-binding protein involved in chromosome partitioning
VAKVKDPALGRDLVAAGMLSEVQVAAGIANIAIRLTTPLCPSRDVIAAAVKAEVARATGLKQVEVTFSAEVARKDGPLPARLPTVRNVLAVAAGKGGVGKSTVASNLAVALAKEGAAVGIMDADVFGPSIPQMMGPPTVETSAGEHKLIPAVHHGIKVVSVGFFVERGAAVIWRGPMIHKLLSQFVEDVEWGELDYLVVDLPPGTGDTQLSLAQLVPVTGAVMVTTPQEVSVIDVEKAVAMWKKVEVPVLGVIENMSWFECPDCGTRHGIFSSEEPEARAQAMGLPFLGAIPIHPDVRAGGDTGRPVVRERPEGAYARALGEVAGRLAQQLSILAVGGGR